MLEPERRRCGWPRGDMMIAYHDDEWGRPCHDDGQLYEMLFLEGFQAGLSWLIVLSKREAFRRAFDGFDPAKIAAYGEADVARLLNAEGIIKNRLKIRGTIANAIVFLSIQKECGSFDAYLQSFIPNGPVVNDIGDVRDLPVSSPLSDAVSADLRKRGMKFVGTVTVYSYLQSVGIVIDHERGCFVLGELAETKE
jgi:DNA-3-methyladenine glycosylase I